MGCSVGVTVYGVTVYGVQCRSYIVWGAVYEVQYRGCSVRVSVWGAV